MAAACRRIESADAAPDLDALATEAGLSRAHFHRGFCAVTGLSAKEWAAARRRARHDAPRGFRRGGAGVAVRFAVGACRLGVVLVATSVRGVCAILLGDDPASLRGDFGAASARAQIVAADADFAATVAAFVDAPRGNLALPLDLQGTAFQRRVWQVLRAIPAGATLTYAELAARIGSPSAARATNTLAVAVPCHRVVRKQALLGREREP